MVGGVVLAAATTSMTRSGSPAAGTPAAPVPPNATPIVTLLAAATLPTGTT